MVKLCGLTVSILLVGSIVNSAHATNSYGLSFITAVGKKCEKVVLENDVACTKVSSDLANAAAEKGATATTWATASGQAIDQSMASTAIASAKESAYATGAGVCSKAAKVCKTECTEVQTELKGLETEYLAQVEYNPSVQPELNNVRTDLKEMQLAFRICAQVIAGKAVQLETSAGLAAKEGADAGSITQLLKNHPVATAVGAAALAGGAGYMLANRGKDDNNNNGSSGTTGTTGTTGSTGTTTTTTTSAEELLKLARQDPSCQSKRAWEFDHCQNFLSKYCANMANMTDLRCESWTNKYCSPVDNNGTVTAAEGEGTQVCKDAAGVKFCKLADTAGCYTCMNNKDRMSPSCATRPDICQREPTANDMSYFKGKCPQDPVFQEAKWANIQAVVTTTSTTPDPATSAVNSPNVIDKRNLASNSTGSLAYTNVGLSNSANNTGRPADVKAAFGPGVLDQMRLTMQAICNKGYLNRCGPRQNVAY